MLQEVKIIASRRAYEFRPDDLRLSAISTKPVQEQIQQLFNFQASLMATPAAMFGDVPATYPPGFVFDMGVWIGPDEQVLVPIRFLHFEQRRIVIDIAGPSFAIDGIFERLQHFFSALRAPDGSPIIGEPEQILDFSEITAKYPFSLDAMLANPFRKALEAVVGEKGSNEKQVLLPTLAIRSFPNDHELEAVTAPNDVRGFTLALRAGTRPEERIYYSGAPLTSDVHLAYLKELVGSLQP